MERDYSFRSTEPAGHDVRTYEAVTRAWATVSLGCVAVLLALSLGLVCIAPHLKNLPRETVVLLAATVTASGMAASYVLYYRMRVELGRPLEPMAARWLLSVAVGLCVIVAPAGMALQARRPIDEVVVLMGACLFAMTCVLVPMLHASAIMAYHVVSQGSETIEYRPTAVDDLPPAARRLFEEHSAAFEQLGFRRLGDYRLKLRTVQFVRHFLSSDGTIIGDIGYLRMFPCATIRGSEMTTLLDDGTIVATGNVPIPKEVIGDRLVMRGVRRGSIAEVYDEHMRSIDQRRRSHGSQLVALRPGDERTIGRYSVLLVNAQCVGEGLLCSNPYDAEAEEIETEIAALLPTAAETQ